MDEIKQELSKKCTYQKMYIPHYGLVRPNKPNKVRRICNAKAPQSGSSLNDRLLTGPDLLGSMLGILLQLRKVVIAIQGDIKAMFMQIREQQQDLHYLQFMWRQPNNPELGVYEYQRHIFGARESPKLCFAKTTSNITQLLWRPFSRLST